MGRPLTQHDPSLNQLKLDACLSTTHLMTLTSINPNTATVGESPFHHCRSPEIADVTGFSTVRPITHTLSLSNLHMDTPTHLAR